MRNDEYNIRSFVDTFLGFRTGATQEDPEELKKQIADLQKQLKERLERGRSWRCVGDIGVDAGIAGFFDGEKPDFTDTEWHDLCSWMSAKDNAAKSKADGKAYGWYIRSMPQTGREGFWTSSGYGDGGYDVYAIHSIIGKKRLTTAVEIRFL